MRCFTLTCVVAVVALVFVAPVAGFAAAGGPADCAAADTGVRARLVIDFGILAAEQGAPASASSQCTSVPAGANGFKVLEAGGHTYRVNSSDLLCAVDGYPAGNECGDRTADGYRYWAYFSGGSKWTYSGIGPGFRGAGEGAVDGWHFVSGKGNPTDPPPNASPQSCAPTPTTRPPTTAAVTTAPTTAPQGPRPTTQAAAPPGGSTGGNTGAGAGSGATTTATTARAAGPGDPAAGAGAGSPADPGGPAGAPPGSEPSTTEGTEVVPIEAAGPTEPGTLPTAAAPSEVDVAASPTAARSSPSSSGAPVAAMLGGLAVLALGGFAVLRMRTRSEDGC